MRKLFVILPTILVLLLLAVTPVMAAPPTVITVGPWLEDGFRYNPDGTPYDISWNDWKDDPNGPMDLRQTGKAYHVVDINDYYNSFATPVPEGHMVISGAGNLSGQAEYVSGGSGLPIRDRFKGKITSDLSALVWEGTYTQYSYAYGTAEEVLSNYSTAVPCDPEDEPEPGEAGWWFIHYTEYIAHQ